MSFISSRSRSQSSALCVGKGEGVEHRAFGRVYEYGVVVARLLPGAHRFGDVAAQARARILEGDKNFRIAQDAAGVDQGRVDIGERYHGLLPLPGWVCGRTGLLNGV